MAPPLAYFVNEELSNSRFTTPLPYHPRGAAVPPNSRRGKRPENEHIVIPSSYIHRGPQSHMGKYIGCMHVQESAIPSLDIHSGHPQRHLSIASRFNFKALARGDHGSWVTVQATIETPMYLFIISPFRLESCLRPHFVGPVVASNLGPSSPLRLRE